MTFFSSSTVHPSVFLRQGEPVPVYFHRETVTTSTTRFMALRRAHEIVQKGKPRHGQGQDSFLAQRNAIRTPDLILASAIRPSAME